MFSSPRYKYKYNMAGSHFAAFQNNSRTHFGFGKPPLPLCGRSTMYERTYVCDCLKLFCRIWGGLTTPVSARAGGGERRETPNDIRLP